MSGPRSQTHLSLKTLLSWVPWGTPQTQPHPPVTYLSIFLAFLVFNHSGKVDQSPEGCHGSCPTKKSGTMVL